MRIVIDAMGGDSAPEVPIAGALAALQEFEGIEIVLVGDEPHVRRTLGTRDPGTRLALHHASEHVSMEETPTLGLRKKDSSISVGLRLLRDGGADAFFSAGNTGAVMAQSILTLGRIPGVSRPAIATIFPTKRELCILMDVGANVDCKPSHLVQFAKMGCVYARDIFRVERPRVGLLSNGEEAGKGNEQTREAHAELSATELNFVGNVEGRDILNGAADVIVTDGFIGNILLKFSESVLDFINFGMKNELAGSPLARAGALLLKPALRRMRRRLDYAEYGGAPLLGVNGISIIGHGRSSAKAVKNAIRAAKISAEQDLNGDLMREFERLEPARRGAGAG
ncbi:MAG: phosphate acyltransferase PlsX [Gemmatimonadetes bacterium]|nr:phosphate acyltransferase PlsX [Gemmatimonadota bacterium]